MSHHIGYTYLTAVVVLSVFLHNVVVCSGTAGEEEEKEKELRPTLMVATMIRNKAHSLPYFLHYLQHLDYPKDRISLWSVFSAGISASYSVTSIKTASNSPTIAYSTY